MNAWRKSAKERQFEQLFLPHLSAAYNLARWLLKDATAAQDIVQESCLRAFVAQHQFTGGNARAWLLKIVRNQSYDWLKAHAGQKWIDIDDETALTEPDKMMLSHTHTPEKLAAALQDAKILHRALDAMPAAFREILILKEIEGFSYKEIAGIADIPIGTVMSRLARGRDMLKDMVLNTL